VFSSTLPLQQSRRVQITSATRYDNDFRLLMNMYNVSLTGSTFPVHRSLLYSGVKSSTCKVTGLPITRVTPQTLVYIGSLSKSYTAVTIVQLVETGKLNLDEPTKKLFTVVRIGRQKCIWRHFGLLEPRLRERFWSPNINDDDYVEHRNHRGY